MKRTPLKRKTGFKRKAYKPMKRTKLRLVGHSTASEQKREIQALCRAIAIKRDGGCILRHYPIAGACGGYNKKGELTLQFDHLNSRVHSVSFADTRLGVTLCEHHHIFWKKQYPHIFDKLVREHIGEERSKLLDRVMADRRPYKLDLKLAIVGLKQEAKKLGITGLQS